MAAGWCELSGQVRLPLADACSRAMGAVYHCQMETLRLRPWQTPPCWVGDERPHVDDHRGEVAAWELRRRLLAAGLSEFEPDPVAALEAIALRQRDGARAQPSLRDSDCAMLPPRAR